MPMPIKITPTEMPGVLLVETGCFGDERGFFSELYSQPVWEAAGFNETFLQDNLSLSRRGTVRGMHYQLEPHGMGKFVRALTGGIFDVGIDLRKGSPTFGKWIGFELTEENRLGVWFPAGIAHGFVALAENTLVLYKCNHFHAPESERAIRYNDPDVGIQWPIEPTIVSKKDAVAGTFAEAEHNFTFA